MVRTREMKTPFIIRVWEAYAKGKMLGIAHNPSTRAVRKVVLCLRVATLALLGALVLAASAQAAELPEVSTPPLLPGATTEPTETGSAAPAPETVSVPPAPAPVPVPETVSAPVEKMPETVSSTPVAGTPVAATESKLEPVSAPEKTPVVNVPAPEALTPEKEKPKTDTGSEKETSIVVAGPEKASEVPPPPIVDTPAVQAVLTRSDLGYATPEIGYEAAPDVSGALINPPADPPTGGTQEVTGSEAAASAAAVAGISGAQQARELSCELSSLDASAGCTSEWLGAQRLLSQSPAGYAAAVAALAPPTGSSGDGGHGGAAVGSPPVSPGPGPAPSGASGSSAGASGLALSGFLTLAGLLLLGAPRAMRRLRLSCQPWRTACFVLIPERPG
jgi:hypothetical protein